MAPVGEEARVAALMRILLERHPAWLILLVLSGAAYTVAPDAGLAPWIKPLPALSAAALVWLGRRAGHRTLVVALVLAAVGDVLLDFEGTARLGTLMFAVVVSVMAVGLRPTIARPPWRGVALAGAWALVSGLLVLSSLGDRLVSGLLVMAATAVFLFVAGRSSVVLAAGALLIASNFTLFAVDLVVAPMPRWLVISTYYVGLLLVAVDRTPDAPGPHPDRVDAATSSPAPR